MILFEIVCFVVFVVGLLMIIFAWLEKDKWEMK